MTKFADKIYKNGAIYTLNIDAPWASAVAIRNGIILAVGEDADVDVYVGPETAVTDLNQKMMLPGLHDMHIHGIFGGIRALYYCDFPMTSSADEIVEAIGRFAVERPEEECIVGGGWLMHIADDIDRAKLDAVCDDRPVFIWDAAVHNAWCNSLMLERANITENTPNPHGGEYCRDQNGRLTGLLLETAAAQVFRAVPERKSEEYAEVIRYLGRMLNQLGVTSIKEAAADRSQLAALKAADDGGYLNLRVGTHLLWITPFIYDPNDLEQLVQDRHQYAGDRVSVDFLKLFLDGVPVAKTAAMLDPYVGDDPAAHDPYGILLVERDRLKKTLVHFDREGFVVKMHATGDASLRAALDAIEAARLANGDSGLGHEIAHPQNVHPDDLPRFAALNAVPDLCPKLWHPSLNKERAVIPMVGPERVARSWPIGSYARSGARMIAGSDWPAAAPTANPWLNMQTLITREDPTGAVSGKLGVDEEISLEEALQIYTINGAQALRHADRCGSIEAGKVADLIVIDQNLFEIDPHDIGKTQVIETMIEGETVWKI